MLVLVVTASSAFPLTSASPQQSSNLPTSSSPATEPADIDGAVAAVLKEGAPSSSVEDEESGAATTPVGLTAQLDNPNYFEGDLNISQEMMDTYHGIILNETEKVRRI